MSSKLGLSLVFFVVFAQLAFADEEAVLSVKQFAPFFAGTESPFELEYVTRNGKVVGPETLRQNLINGGRSITTQDLTLTVNLRKFASDRRLQNDERLCFLTRKKLIDPANQLEATAFNGACEIKVNDATHFVWPVENRLVIREGGADWFYQPGMVLNQQTRTRPATTDRELGATSALIESVGAIPSFVDVKAGEKICKLMGYRGMNEKRSRVIEPNSTSWNSRVDPKAEYLNVLWARGVKLNQILDKKDPHRPTCPNTWNFDLFRGTTRCSTGILADLAPVNKFANFAATAVTVDERGEFTLKPTKGILGLLVCDRQLE
ncbi:MAG: hypothetical protein IT288_08555 [Bdellovibrionales bacterium]|nr:hypothetical protein [Bdellovibrionales bacterium]